MEAFDKAGEARKAMRPYRCFLVRCRLEEGVGPDREPGWRFTVQQADPGAARRSFACFHDVAIYLEAELEACDKQAARQAAREDGSSDGIRPGCAGARAGSRITYA